MSSDNLASQFSLDTALTNLSNAFGDLQHLIIAIAYITGLYLIVRGIMMYKVFGSQTMASAQRGEFAGPLVHIVIGAILLYIPSTLNTSLTTIFGDTTIGQASDLIGYKSFAATEKWQELSDVIVQYMYLVGLIAFIRGWVILSKMGHSGSQPGSIGKGLIHVIGGILLINVVDTFNLLASTFGYTGS
jgi:intracellular multiplication protein IcmC